MKKFICMLFCVLMLTTPVYAQTAETDAFDVPQEWQQIFDDAPVSKEDWSNLSFPKLVEMLVQTVKNRINQPLRLFMRISALLLFASLARGLCPDSTINSIGTILDNVITLAVFTICAVPILSLIENMINTLETNKNYLSAFVPVFSSVLVSCGQIGSAAVYSGFFFGTVTMIANFLCIFALPGIRVFFALCVMDGVCNVFDFSKLTAICVKAIKWLLMICATVFIAVMGLQSAFADAADSVAMRTGKLILSASVPVIGRAVSDAMGSVYAGLKLLKGTAGVALVGVLAVSFIPLLIEAAVYYLLLNIGSMVAAATSNQGSAKMFSGLAEGVSLAMLLVFFFGIMAILATVMMILLGGSL